MALNRSYFVYVLSCLYMRRRQGESNKPLSQQLNPIPAHSQSPFFFLNSFVLSAVVNPFLVSVLPSLSPLYTLSLSLFSLPFLLFSRTRRESLSLIILRILFDLLAAPRLFIPFPGLVWTFCVSITFGFLLLLPEGVADFNQAIWSVRRRLQNSLYLIPPQSVLATSGYLSFSADISLV